MRPNIVWFITDDTNHKMLGCYGGKVLSPNIDSLAAGGIQFRNFYCPAAACTPSRYTYLTGHHASRCPADRFQPPQGEPCKVWFNTDLDPARERSIGQAMQSAGYTTGFVGKWHVGGGPTDLAAMPTLARDDDPRDPVVNRRMKEHQRWLCDMVHKNGFDHAASVVHGNHQTIPDAAANHNLEWTTRGALDFIDASAGQDKPFFLNMATTAIHEPDHAQSLMADPHLTAGGYGDNHIGCLPPRKTIYERLRQADGIDFNSTTAGVLWMDDAVGAVMERIRQLGLEDETLLVWSTDHGFSGGKFSVYEAGVRIPFLIQWKGHLPEGMKTDAICQNVDLLPTLFDLVDAEAPEGMILDGVSMAPILRNPAETASIREDLYCEFGYARSVRCGRWKYIAYRLPSKLLEPIKSGEADALYTHFGRPMTKLATRANLMTPLILNIPHYFDPDQLYDLEVDPYEQGNLADDPAHAGVLREMKDRLGKHLDALGQSFPLQEVDPFYTSDRFATLRDSVLADLKRHDADYWELARIGGFDEITRDFYGLKAEGDS